MSASRRFHLILPGELEIDAKAFGRRMGIGLGPAIRLLVARGLGAEATAPASPAAVSPTLLATLTAAEHAVLMVASILPEGERRMRSLADRATEAAAQRLTTFTETAEAER